MSLPAENPHDDDGPGSVRATEAEVDLSTLLDLQDERTAKDSKQANKIILGFCGFLVCLALGWYAAAESNRRKVAGLIENLRASGKDAQMMQSPSSMASEYDLALEKLGTHSTEIDNASISLGVDPKKVHEDGMENEMKTMMGGKGVTVGERNRLLQRTAGVVMGSDAKVKRLKESSHAALPQVEASHVDKPAVPDAAAIKH